MSYSKNNLEIIMKKINILSELLVLFFIFIFSINIYSQSGWVQQYSGVTGNVAFIEAVDANNAFVGNPGYKTTDGGATWFSISGPTVTEIQMVNTETGYVAAGSDYPYKTTNGGLNWLALPLAAPENYDVSFINENNGFIGGLHDGDYLDLFKTTDGGVNWTVRGVSIASWPEFTQAFNDVKMLDNNVIYVTFYVFHQFTPLNVINYLKKSTNDGGWFSTMMWDSSSAYYEMVFPSATTGFVITYGGGQYKIIKSVNDNWGATISLTTTDAIQGIEFPSVNTGYAVCAGGIMFKTTNGGNNWYRLSTGTTRTLRDVKFIDELTGWIVGDSGLILKTTTGGEAPVLYSVSGTVRFEDNNQPVTSGYVKALRYDEQTQNIITVDSTGIQSDGTYMLIHCPPIPVDIMAYENDENHASYVPTYYVSTIYWENATNVTPDTNLTGIDIGVYRINNTTGNMHIGGGVYKYGTADMLGLKNAVVYARIGNVFKGYSISGNNGLYRIDSLSAGTYELICNRMGFYSAVRPFNLTTFSVDTIDFVLSTLLVSIEPNGQIIPEKFFLSQNYPNPFNPATKIKFGLPEQSHAKLTVYDVLGREVAVLVNEELKAGEYNVEWNASVLSSGIYFYRLVTEKYTQTKKMVLMK
jgi:photosystem II stability/assembly factor-like uncharacterized protein